MIQSNLLHGSVRRSDVAPAVAEQADRGRWLRQAGLWSIWILGAPIGFDIARTAAPIVVEPSLLTLLRMMAVMKFAMAVAAFALVKWRFSLPTRPVLAFGYWLATAMMYVAGPLIWHPSHLIIAGLLFYSGLLTLLALAFVDRDGAGETVSTAGVYWRSFGDLTEVTRR